MSILLFIIIDILIGGAIYIAIGAVEQTILRRREKKHKRVSNIIWDEFNGKIEYRKKQFPPVRLFIAGYLEGFDYRNESNISVSFLKCSNPDCLSKDDPSIYLIHQGKIGENVPGLCCPACEIQYSNIEPSAFMMDAKNFMIAKIREKAKTLIE